MNIRLRSVVRGVFAVAVIGALMCTVPGAAAARVWTIASTPNRDATFNCLSAAAGGYGRGDVWAVGAWGEGGCYDKALIEYRQAGHPWRIVPAARLKGWDMVNLLDVVSVSPDDAWTVGGGLSKDGDRPVIEHWNGSTWTHVPSYEGQGGLKAIARVPGTSHVWTVGSTNYQSVNLIGYWNGARWRFTTMRQPKQGGDQSPFTSVAATSDHDVWAIASTNADSIGTVGRAYAEHWNGQRWTLVWMPGTKTRSEQLRDAANVPDTTQVWAVGQYYLPAAMHLLTLTERYANGRWQIVPSPDRGVRSVLTSVVAISPDNVWAAGIWYGRKWHSATLIEHYTHGRWHIVRTPNMRGMQTNELYGITAVRRGARRVVWAVGLASPRRFDGGAWRTLALRGR